MQNSNGPERPEKLNRTDKPVPRKAPRVEVVRLRGGESFSCTILSSKFSGFVVHWNAVIRRSRPCYESRENCEGCKDELPAKTLYYLHVWSGTKGSCFLEMTAHAAFQLQEIFGSVSTYRGQRITVERTRAANGRLKVDVKEWSENAANLPPEEDPEDVLRKLWDWKRS
jgi:hypothetical protein